MHQINNKMKLVKLQVNELASHRIEIWLQLSMV